MPKRVLLHAIVMLSSLALTACPAKSDEFVRGRVISVSDGDTIVIRDDRRRSHTVRIHAIDAPERHQPQASRSRQSLSSMTKHRTVIVLPVTIDPYGRIVGKVLLGEQDVGLEQVRRGMAWHYAYYAGEQSREDRATYFAAEKAARERREGIWSQANPVAPWDWRRWDRRRAAGE